MERLSENAFRYYNYIYIETVYYAHSNSNYSGIYFYGDRIGNKTIFIMYSSIFISFISKVFSIAVVINSFKEYKLNELKSAKKCSKKPMLYQHKFIRNFVLIIYGDTTALSISLYFLLNFIES